jgi:hypothetical protein
MGLPQRRSSLPCAPISAVIHLDFFVKLPYSRFGGKLVSWSPLLLDLVIIWDDEDDPEGNYWHICIEGHGLTRGRS